MDSNHYCQTRHYNKQSLFPGGEEAGIWDECDVINRTGFDLSN